MKKILLFLFFIALTISLTAKTWIREYTYHAGEADSKLTSRAIALEQVKRILLEEIGVYVYSELLTETTESNGKLNELTAKQIEIISAGITETKIVEETWNGEIYYIKAEITADEKDVLKKLDKVINDKHKTKQLEKSRRKTDEALAKIEELKKQLAQTQDEKEKLEIQKSYNQTNNALTAEDWFQKGYNAHEIEDYDNAILYYQKAIALDPDLADAYYNIGIVYGRDKGNYDKAIECFQNAIAIDPDYAKAFYNMGNVYNNKGNYAKAIECYEKAIALDPDLADAYYNMGIIYGRDKSNYRKAIECCQNAISIDPDYASAYNNMGIAYTGKNNYDKAIECYEKAIAIDPDLADAYLNMGSAHHYKGNLDKAIEYYQKAARLGNEACQKWLRENNYSW